MENKKEVTIQRYDAEQNKQLEITITNPEICDKIFGMLIGINTKNRMIKTYSVLFILFCIVTLVLCVLYVTKYEFLLSPIMLIGSYNIFNLMMKHKCIDSKAQCEHEFNEFIGEYIKKMKLQEKL